MTDFASMTKVNMRAVPSGMRSVYLEVSSRDHRRLFRRLDAAQPFHVDVALPTGNHQAQRIALLGAQGFAVLSPGDQGVVQSLLERAGCAASCRHRRLRRSAIVPVFACRLRPGAAKAERRSIRCNWPGRGSARRCGRLSCPIRRCYCRSTPGSRCGKWKAAAEILHGEDERPVDQAVNEELVLGGIDRRHTGMVALVVQRGGSQDAAGILQRGQAVGGFGESVVMQI